MLRVLERRTAPQRERPSCRRHAGDDQQRRLVTASPTQRQGRVDQGAEDPAPASVRVDHPGDLDRWRSEPVEAEEADQSLPLPPQQIPHLASGPAAERTPLELQPSAVGRENPLLQSGHRLEFPGR